MLESKGDRLGAARDIQFLVKGVGMELHCPLADKERVRDLLVAQPLRDQHEHFALPLGQRFDRQRGHGRCRGCLARAGERA